MQCCRAQLRTNVLNIRSQKAIQKISGVYEGTFRNDLIRTNGTHRDSIHYSIVDKDWPMAKLKYISSCCSYAEVFSMECLDSF